ncbi:WUSCHEL-related homeobox 9-like isoform X2 [Benincasa hispida]|uniref:WUSCHEL-related homeobox 9-like isoform X2 n=1 Tax=Benincasa hispida TaxID=102211 RepID=UPI0019025936|nr:WUSCHEL-related homeobox 9-like isoform X2 [Benincasa hispida]
MASSNRHWPSMFKSKPCNSHHQWQHDINTNLSSSTATTCLRSAPYTTVGGCEERSPEPKPRWNPKPEQIRILEAIFNSGMVNPPRDEIRKIRAQLQEYGQVGDANVFYWFQNRKSRSKNKLRHIQNSKSNHNSQTATATTTAIVSIAATTTTTCSSSSSSDKSSPKKPPIRTPTSNNSVTQNYLQQPTNDVLPEPFFFPVSQTGSGGGSGSCNLSQGFCFSELCSVVQQVPEHGVGPCTSLLLSEIMSPQTEDLKKDLDQDKINMVKLEPQFMNFHPCLTSSTTDHTLPQTTISTPLTTLPSPTNAIPQGVGEVCGVGQSCVGKSTVFINGVAFEVASGPFNVREAFGNEAVLIHSNGQPVLTNDWGLTLHSLQHGSYYYLI